MFIYFDIFVHLLLSNDAGGDFFLISRHTRTHYKEEIIKINKKKILNKVYIKGYGLIVYIHDY